MLLYGFLYKAQTKQTCHITASKVNYHMPWLTTNSKCLNLGISLKFDQLQNISLTQTSHHDNVSSKYFADVQPHPVTFSQPLIGYQIAEATFPALIGHQDTWLIIVSCLLIIIPGIHITLHAFAMTRSLIIPLKPCSILLKFVFQYIATLYLFYHCISIFISYAFCIKM